MHGLMAVRRLGEIDGENKDTAKQGIGKLSFFGRDGIESGRSADTAMPLLSIPPCYINQTLERYSLLVDDQVTN